MTSLVPRALLQSGLSPLYQTGCGIAGRFARASASPWAGQGREIRTGVLRRAAHIVDNDSAGPTIFRGCCERQGGEPIGYLECHDATRRAAAKRAVSRETGEQPIRCGVIDLSERRALPRGRGSCSKGQRAAGSRRIHRATGKADGIERRANASARTIFAAHVEKTCAWGGPIGVIESSRMDLRIAGRCGASHTNRLGVSRGERDRDLRDI